MMMMMKVVGEGLVMVMDVQNNAIELVLEVYAMQRETVLQQIQPTTIHIYNIPLNVNSYVVVVCFSSFSCLSLRKPTRSRCECFIVLINKR